MNLYDGVCDVTDRLASSSMDMDIMKDKGLSSSGRNMFITFDFLGTESNLGFEINIHKGIEFKICLSSSEDMLCCFNFMGVHF